jgi:serine/threonine-protein kinase
MTEPEKRTKSPTSPVPDFKRGTRFGKYRIEKSLGQGGSCEVWQARDTVEGIWVALKIPNLVNGVRNNEQLLREIRLVSKLRHPHIMPVKNADIIHGHAVLATELSTKTLDDCSRPMSPRKILSMVVQVLDGLAYAHRHRVVHCDVTPGNIFLFPDGRAALGDFGIGQRVVGRMKTIDDFGTPGYVAPEQAYGKPTFRSDCFAVALILYEFLTAVLPAWPFNWPLKGYDRLKKKTSISMVRFLRHALEIDPAKRFANAEQMLSALLAAAPRRLHNGYVPKIKRDTTTDWKQMRRSTFLRRYDKSLNLAHKCIDCGEPISEAMSICPWCGSTRNRFDTTTRFNRYCPDCKRGVMAEWPYCPWCYDGVFEPQQDKKPPKVRYNARCKHCNSKMMRFMRYCPWCHRKVRHPWRVSPLPEICGKCGWSVDSNYWSYCPWCSQFLA